MQAPVPKVRRRIGEGWGGKRQKRLVQPCAMPYRRWDFLLPKAKRVCADLGTLCTPAPCVTACIRLRTRAYLSSFRMMWTITRSLEWSLGRATKLSRSGTRNSRSSVFVSVSAYASSSVSVAATLSMCLRVDLPVCLCVLLCLCLCLFSCLCLCLCLCVCAFVYVYVCVRVFVCICVYMCVRVRVRKFMCACACACA